MHIWALQICQNKMARFVGNLHGRAHIGNQEILDLNWLPIEKRVAQLKLHQIHKVTYKRAPEYLMQYFQERNVISQHNTRNNSLKYDLPFVKSKSARSTFLYTSVEEWNKLPSVLRETNNFNSFKNLLRKHLHNVIQKEANQDFVYY